MRKKLHEVQIKAAMMINKIGTTNGTNPPDSQDPMDALMHEMAIAKTLSSIADKRYEQAKNTVVSKLGIPAMSALLQLEKDVIKNSASMRTHLISGQHYQLNCEVRQAGSRFDEKKLRVELMSKHNLTSEQLDVLWESCKAPNAPRKYFEVIDKGDE